MKDFFVSLLFYMVALLLSAAALMWFVNDHLAWSYEESFSVMAGAYIGMVFYEAYSDFVATRRRQTQLRRKRERARRDFVEYNSKA